MLALLSPLTAGLILLIAGPDWFPGAATVGLILTIVGGVLLAFVIALFVLVFIAAVLD